MRPQQRLRAKLLLLVLALGLTECAKNKTKSQEVSITVAPPHPIVFTNDYSYPGPDGNPVQITGPWFQFSVGIDNQSSSAVTIIALHIEVTGVDANGAFTTNTIDFLPSSYNVQTTTLACQFADFGEFEAKGATGHAGSLGVTASNGSSSCPNGSVTFRAGSNPKPAQTTYIRYTVKVQPEGYFGVRGSPTDRFDNYTTIYTQ